jgi:hypothetical protein
MDELKNISDTEKTIISRKELINHFLLFRFVGSLVLLGIIGFILDYQDRHSASSGSDLWVGIGIVTILNVPVQLYYLIQAFIAYNRQRKTTNHGNAN